MSIFIVYLKTLEHLNLQEIDTKFRNEHDRIDSIPISTFTMEKYFFSLIVPDGPVYGWNMKLNNPQEVI